MDAPLALGDSHSCSSQADNSFWCWGDNSSGALGNGATLSSVSPIQLTALGTSVAQAAAGFGFTCVRKVDGTLWCWGNNNSGALGNGSFTSSASPVQVTALGASVAQVAAEYIHACARKTDGTLWCWGDNGAGQLGDGTKSAHPSPVQVAALGSTVAQVAAGEYHTCARKTDGTLWCWGDNSYGQIGDGTTVQSAVPLQVAALGTSVAQVAAGYGYTCARKTDGTLWCWGYNFYGQLGNGSTTACSSPVQVVALGTSVVQVALGGGQACAAKTDGTLWCWGQNSWGEIGNGSTSQSASPVQVMAVGG